MYSLPVRILFPVEDCVLVLWPHLLLPWHLCLPPLDLLHATALLLQRSIDASDNGVDSAETFALTCFLHGREAPGYLPVEEYASLQVMGIWEYEGTSYQRRPPDNGEVALNGPNIRDKLLFGRV